MITSFLDNINNNSTAVSLNRLNTENKEKNEQYFTPLSVASFMSSMFKPQGKSVIRFLDAGAGLGNLTASFISTVCKWENKPQKIIAVLYEIDSTLIPDLNKNIELAKEFCENNNIELEVTIINQDYIESCINDINFKDSKNLFDYILLNPPYKKMGTNQQHKQSLMKIGIDVPNFYAAFVALSYRLLNKKAQLVCIIPRSFCNGQYFKAFRKDLTTRVKIEKLHVFDSRKNIFKDDVLQETLIMYLSKNKQNANDRIEVTQSVKDEFSEITTIQKSFEEVVFTNDPENLIRIIKDEDTTIVERMHNLNCVLKDLNISVSTGPIVDFREHPSLLSHEGNIWSLPIIYPENFVAGFVKWPIFGKKPGFILESESNINKLREPGIYVLVKRMSSKEERKRVVAAIYNSEKTSQRKVAFNNNLNYFHINFSGLDNLNLARGLSLYLNSSLVDNYFRTFSGSTQVNVGDLKTLKYPSLKQLEFLGTQYDQKLPSQERIDHLIDNILFF